MRVSNIRICNAFIFLEKIYVDLSVKQFNELDKEKVETIEEVYIQYLIRLVDNLYRRGLYTEYREITDVELDLPRGRINIPESIKTMQRQRLVCSYDELSNNVLHNQIIKTALSTSMYNNKITDVTINKLRKAISKFNGIDYIDYSNVKWREIKYNNFNIRYKSVINLCERLYNFSKVDRGMEVSFEDKLYLTFKEFIVNFYKELVNQEMYNGIISVDTIISQFSSSARNIEMMILKANKCVVVKTDDKAIIIGCTLYVQDMDYTEFDTQLKELKLEAYKYYSDTGVKPLGVLIHCNPTFSLTTSDMKMYNVDNFNVTYVQLDLAVEYKYIEYKLRRVVDVLLNIKNIKKETSSYD